MSTKGTLSYKQHLNSNSVTSYNASGDIIGTTVTTALQTLSTNKERTGVANPKWREQVKACQNASTDFSATLSSAGFQRHTYEFDRTSASGLRSTGFGRMVPVSLPLYLNHLADTKADNRARQDFYKTAIKVQRRLQSGVFLGEIRETLKMIRSPAKGARSILSNFIDIAKKIYKRPKGLPGKSLSLTDRFKQIKRSLADSWLEFSFGWSPLAADLHAASNILADLASRADLETVVVEGIGFEEDNPANVFTLLGLASNRPYGCSQLEKRYRSVFVKYYGRIRLDVPGSADSRVMTALGLTVHDIIPTIWELVPWSFFVDYFTNIGDVLEAWSYPAAKLAWASKVVVKKRTVSTMWSFDAARHKQLMGTTKEAVMNVNPKRAIRSSAEKTVQRTATVYVRPPEFEFELPFSSRKFLNIGALLAASKYRPRR